MGIAQSLLTELQLLQLTGWGSVALRNVSWCHVAQLFDRTPFRVQSHLDTILLRNL